MIFCVAALTSCSQSILIKPFEPLCWKIGKVKTLRTAGPVICPMSTSTSGLEKDFKLQYLDWSLKSYSSPGKAHIIPTFSSCCFPTELPLTVGMLNKNGFFEVLKAVTLSYLHCEKGQERAHNASLYFSLFKLDLKSRIWSDFYQHTLSHTCHHFLLPAVSSS